MGKIFVKINKLLRRLDLFPTSNFICYNGQSQYTTATGGLVSIAVFVIFIVLFASMGFRTINRQIIQASTSIQNDANPTPLNIKTSPDNNFMFSISILGIDLNNDTFKLFDIVLLQTYYGAGYKKINDTVVPLVKCTPNHFAFDSNITEALGNFKMDRGLCPPIGQSLQVSGKVSSNSSSFLNLVITRCNPTLNPFCVNDAVFQQIEAAVGGDFLLATPIINTEINPANSDYKSTYIEDRNGFYFNSQMGVSALASIQQVIVNTDISILPITNTITQTFTVIPRLFSGLPYLKTSQKPYATIVFSKSTQTVTHTRSFNKFDAYFSYVGGLIGTIIGLIFIIQFYTQKAFEISISDRLFKNSDQSEINSSSFNIGYFFLMVIKSFLDLFPCKLHWEKTEKFMDCCQQINFQLDISYMLRKLMVLETAVDILFKKHQIQALYLRDKPSVEKAKSQRRKYFRPQLIGASFVRKNEEEFEKRQSLVSQLNFQQKAQKSSISQKVSDISAASINPSSEVEQVEQFIDQVIIQSRQGNTISNKILSQIGKKFSNPLIKLQANKKTFNKRGIKSFELEIPEIQSEINVKQK